VRVNPPETPFFDGDLDATVAAGAAAVMLPKCQSPGTLAEVAGRIDALEQQHDRPRGSVRLLALVETAAGIAHIASLADGAPRVDALCFGHADFSRDMGLPTADASGGVVLHARCSLAVAAHAAGLAAVDTIFGDVRDAEGFRRDAELGRSLGFEGKLCIHPGQVALANEVHTPSGDQIDFARRVVEASKKAEAEGRGVFTVDGKMMDAPLVAAQVRVLERARRAGAIGAEDS